MTNDAHLKSAKVSSIAEDRILGPYYLCKTECLQHKYLGKVFARIPYQSYKQWSEACMLRPWGLLIKDEN